jgi:hypothetical protein
MTVGVRIGSHRHAAGVIGPRFCDYVNGKLAFTSPKPFEEMPLRYENAYGGRDLLFEEAILKDIKQSLSPDQLRRAAPYADLLREMHPLMYPRNRFGKGYVLSDRREHIEGRELPNLERHDDRLTPERLIVGNPFDWHKQPVPVGFDYLEPLAFPRSALLGFPPGCRQGLETVSEVSWGLLPPDFRPKNIFITPGEEIPSLVHELGSRCASLGLWLAFLRGDEEVLLSGMDSKYPEFRVKLPAERPEFVMKGTTGMKGTQAQTSVQPYLIEVDLYSKLLNVIWVGRSPLPAPLFPGQSQELALEIKVQMRRA